MHANQKSVLVKNVSTLKLYTNHVLSLCVKQNFGKEQEEREDILNPLTDHQLCISCQYSSLDISVCWICLTNLAPVVSISMDLTA